MKIIYAVLLLTVILPGSAIGQANDTVTTGRPFRYGQLPNGFTYYLARTPGPHIFFELVVRAGYAAEERDQQGLAHLLEHVIALNGTRSYPGGINAYRQSEGLTHLSGGASTQLTCTKYYQQIPADNQRAIEHAFHFFGEIAFDTLVAAKLRNDTVVNNERLTVLQEYQGHDLLAAKKNFLLSGSPWGNRLYDPAVSETQHNQHIRTFQKPSLQRFYEKWYKPAHQAIIITGDIDMEKMESAIIKQFGSLPASNHFIARQARDVSALRISLDGKNHVWNMVDKKNSRITVEYLLKHPATRIHGVVSHISHYREDITRRLYNHLMRSRFAQLTQQYNTPFETISHVFDYIRPAEAQINAVETKFSLSQPRQISHAIFRILIELQRVKRFGFSTSEFKAASAATLQDIQSGNDGQATLLAHCENHFLHGGQLPTENESQILVKTLRELTVAQINQLAKEWLSGKINRDLIITHPTDTSAAITEAEFENLFTKAEKTALTPYTPPETLHTLMLKPIVDRLQTATPYEQYNIVEIGATGFQLSNGIKIIVKPLRSTASNERQLRIHGFSGVGATAFSSSDYFSAIHAGTIIDHSGVGGFDQFELSSFKRLKNLAMDVNVSDHGTSIQGNGPVENIESLLQLMYLYFTVPNKSQPAFTDWLNRQTLELVRPPSASKVFFDSVEHILGMQQPLTLTDIQQVQLEKVFEVYKKIFSSTSDFTFTIAGNFTVEEIKPLLLKYLNNLPAGPPSAIKRNIAAPAPVTPITKTFYTSEPQENMPVIVGYTGRYVLDQVNKLQLDVLSKLLLFTSFNRLVQKEGTYGASAGAFYFHPEQYRINIQFESEDALIDKRIRAVLQELAQLKMHGPPIAMFDTIISRLQQEQQQLLHEPLFWCNYLERQLRYRGDLAEVNHMLSLLRQITPADIKMLANTLFANEGFFQFVLRRR